MYCSQDTLKLALDKGFTYCTCSNGGYPDCICESKGYGSVRLDDVSTWLREECNLLITISSIYDKELSRVTVYKLELYNLKPPFPFSWYHKLNVNDLVHNTYYKALEHGISLLLELIKK